MNCIVLKGVKVGAGSIVGAGSVVVSDIESGCLYAGNPAKK
jgi:acetyltransferase-like isoleucine patch superfamily enzyme